MICISSRLDEMADIWIRRIIKAIRLQLNCPSRGRGGVWGGGEASSLCVKRGGPFRVKRQQVCARVRARASLRQVVRIRTCDLNTRSNCPKTAHQCICLLPLGSNNML